MKNCRMPILVAILAWLTLVLVTRSEAQSTTGQVQGTVARGVTLSNVKPVAVGGRTAGGLSADMTIGPSAGVVIEGTIAPGSSGATASPFLIAGLDKDGEVTTASCEQSGNVNASSNLFMIGQKVVGGSADVNKINSLAAFDYVSRALVTATTGELDAGTPKALPCPLNSNTTRLTWSLQTRDTTNATNFGVDTVTRISDVASNGTTPVTLVSASGSTVVYVGTISISNTNTTTDHWVKLLSSTGPTTILGRIYLPAKATVVIDGRGDVKTDAADGLQFVLDAAGTDVYASGTAVRK